MTGYIRTRWSKLKKEVESRFAPCVERRVELFMTGYHKFHNEVGRWAVKIDGEEVFGVGDCESWKYKHDERGSLKEQDHISKGFHERDDLLHSLKEFMSLPIDMALESNDVIIRSLSVLDKRIGKRRLKTLRIHDTDHDLVRRCLLLRRECEEKKSGPPNKTISGK